MNPKIIKAYTPNFLPMYFNFESGKFENEAEQDANLCKEDYLTADFDDLERVKGIAQKQGYSNVFIGTITFASVEEEANK